MQATRQPLGKVNLFGMYIIPSFTITTCTHFTYPQMDGGLSQPQARLSQELVGIEPGTSHMKVCWSTNWAIPARPCIQSTAEGTRPDGFISFLDTLIIPEPDRTLSTTIYSKSTHTDQYLHQTATTTMLLNIVWFNTLPYRAITVSSNPILLQKEG